VCPGWQPENCEDLWIEKSGINRDIDVNRDGIGLGDYGDEKRLVAGGGGWRTGHQGSFLRTGGWPVTCDENRLLIKCAVGI
jgi:hypothetical protein